MVMTAGALAAGITALGGIGSSIVSNATSARSQKRAYNYSRALQQQQYDLGIRGYKEAPSAQRKGLTDAGYNPMLALGNVGNGVNVSGGTPVGANATDVSGIRDSIATAVQLRNQTEQTKASADASYADADLKKAQKASELERLPYVSKREKAEYQKTAMETAKLENDIHYQNEYLNYLSNSLDVQQKVAEISANAHKYSADKSYTGTVYNADSVTDTMLKTMPTSRSQSFRNYTSGARDILSGIGSVIHGNENNFEFYDESRTVTNHSPKNHSSEVYRSRRSGRRKKR